MEQQTKTKRFYKHKISNLVSVKNIVTVHYQALPLGYVSHTEKHGFWEIVYADTEDLVVVIDGNQNRLCAGEMLLIAPNATHFLFTAKKETNIFIISFSCSAESLEMLANRPLLVADENKQLLQSIMSEAMQTFQIPEFDPYLSELKLQPSPNLGGKQVIKNALELLLIYSLRAGDEKKLGQKYFISKILSSSELQDEIVKILSQNVYGSLGLNELSQKLHYGKTHLCTVFKKKTGESIYSAYLKLKTAEAKRLIRKGLPFSQIAELLQFDSPAHFSATFKRNEHMTPKQYKESIR